MKKIILVFATFFVLTFVHGQTWAPIGAKWTYGLGFAWSNNISYNEWISAKDTLVGGHICKLIKRNGAPTVSDISDKLITYEDSNIVYWFNTLINQFTTLYDFNKNTGEAWTIQLDTLCSLLVTVDSTDIETINSFPLKVLYISSPFDAFSGKVLYHIGNIVAPNPYILFQCYGIISDGTYYTGLRCYEDSVFGFHDFNIAPSCNYVITGLSEQDLGSRINIFPNPFSIQTTLQTDKVLKNATLKVYNSFGQQVKQIKNISGQTITLQRDKLTSGIYFIRLMQDDKTFVTGKIIITGHLE